MNKLAALLFSVVVIAGGACADVGDDDPALSQDSTTASRAKGKATVVVHYDTGWGHQITLRGAGGGLDWTRGRPATWTDGDAWTIELTIDAAVEVKPLVDDATWSLGPNYVATPGKRLDIYPHFFTGKGRLERLKGVTSAELVTRDVVIYLPPSYDENKRARFPVVYMHDGQNLYDDASSFGGVSWDATGAMDRGVAAGTFREAIIVGIDNTNERIWEYTPTDGGYDGGGADAYLAFIATELKPRIDRDYRTLPGRADTALIGSSLGGLVSVYGGLSQATVFGLIGGLSPSTWWDGTWILAQVQSSKALPLRVYVDSGDSGTSADDKVNTAKLADAFKARGVPLSYVVQKGASHNEYYWRQRLPGALAFLLGPR